MHKASVFARNSLGYAVISKIAHIFNKQKEYVTRQERARFAVFRIMFHFRKMIRKTTKNLTERHRNRARYHIMFVALSRHPKAYQDSALMLKSFLKDCQNVIIVNQAFRAVYLKIVWIQKKFQNQIAMMAAKLEVLNQYWDLVIN